jgi:hypothetical protein
LYKAGAFVPGKLFQSNVNGLGWKSLPETNALAYHKNSQITTVKSFKTLVPAVGDKEK